MQSLQRRFPVRIGLVILACFMVLVDVGLRHYLQTGISEDVFQWLMGLFVTAIGGDTWRPSGKVVGRAGEDDEPPRRPGLLRRVAAAVAEPEAVLAVPADL